MPIYNFTRLPRLYEFTISLKKGIIYFYIKFLSYMRPEFAPRRIREQTNFSGEGFTLHAIPIELPQRQSAVRTQMNEPWNLENYQIPREPLVVGDIQDKEAFAQPCLSVVTMPIRLPGSDAFRIPIEFDHLREVLQMSIDYEAAINPKQGDYYAYLTVDQKPINAGSSQRAAGLHIDGQQLAYYPNPFPPEQEYVVSNAAPTTFYPGQTIDFSDIDPTARDARDKFNTAIRTQTDRSSGIVGVPFRVYLFDSYIVHESTPVQEDTERTFVKINFSPRQLNTVGNNGSPTRNPVLEYDWEAPSAHEGARRE